MEPGTYWLLMLSFFSYFSFFFFLVLFFHLSVTPTLCIGNDGKGWLCACICCCLMRRSRDTNFKVPKLLIRLKEMNGFTFLWVQELSFTPLGLSPSCVWWWLWVLPNSFALRARWAPEILHVQSEMSAQQQHSAWRCPGTLVLWGQFLSISSHINLIAAVLTVLKTLVLLDS